MILREKKRRDRRYRRYLGIRPLVDVYLFVILDITSLYLLFMTTGGTQKSRAKAS